MVRFCRPVASKPHEPPGPTVAEAVVMWLCRGRTPQGGNSRETCRMSVGIALLLVNARHLHNVPGRKTDVRDCQWLQLLHSCGLQRGWFRPGEAITRLRAEASSGNHVRTTTHL
jgi:hypothetical protein